MNKLLFLALALPLASLAASAEPARATSLPAATSLASCIDDGDSASTDGGLSCSRPGNQGTITESPFATLTAASSAGGGVFEVLNYAFEVTGGSAGDQVPVLVSTNLFTSADYADYGFSEIVLSDAGGVVAQQTVCMETGGCGEPASQFSGAIPFFAYSGQIDTVHLEVESSVNSAFGGSAFASADPYFFVNPTFAEAGNYQIILTDGVGNGVAGGVPEPSTWAITLLGFAGLGFAGYRRVRSSAIPACVTA